MNRRQFLACLTAAGPGIVAGATPGRAAPLRGTIDAGSAGLRAGTGTDQSRLLKRLLDEAAAARLPVFLPPGDYVVSGIVLPDGTHLSGVAGATRLIHGGGGSLLSAQDCQRVTIADLSLDGGGQPLGQDADGLIHARSVASLTLENLHLDRSSRHGVHAERCGGRVDRCTIARAAIAGIYAVESRSLAITANTVTDCDNGGILVHRWEAAEDGTMVSGNRISRIGATLGGTGENGNGINVFRAANVMVTGNHVSDCAFSAIRANAASDVQIAGNQCLRSGETAIYSEFGFQGAVVTANLIDGAANGILIVNFNEGGRLAVVSNNLVRNLEADGPYVHDGAGFGFGIAVEADTVVSGNTIENAPKYGLMLGWGPFLRNVVATGNLVRGAAAGCAVTVVEGSGTALISDNLFQNVTEGGIVGYRWNDRATGDLMAAGSQTFAHLTLEGNRLS